jgi:hypothetical protein
VLHVRYELGFYISEDGILHSQNKLTLWSSVCKRTIPTERPPMPTFVDRGVSRGQRGGSPTVVNLSFLDRSRYFSFK